MTGHQIHLDLQPGTTKHIRVTCTCGFVAEHQESIPEVFRTIKEHIGD